MTGDTVAVETAGRFQTRRIVLLSTAAFSVLFLLLSFYMFGQLRHSQLGLIDDHEIVRFLGSDHVIRLFDFPGILFGQTEVGRWGEAPRLRPVYYSLRIIESALWGTNAGLWYLTRMALVALTAIGMSVVVLRATLREATDRLQGSLAVMIALIAGVLVLTLPSWSDIATRLGPSEIYVGPAVMIFALGATEIWRAPSRRHGWILLVVGYLLALGSKEDCLVLLVPLAVVSALEFSAAKRPRLLVVLFVIAAAATLYQAVGIALGTAGQDMYGNGRSFGLLVDVLRSNPFLATTVFFTAIAAIWDGSQLGSVPASSGISRADKALSQIRRFPFTLVGIVTVAVVLGEAYLYQNYFSEGAFSPERYGFITELCLVAGFVVVLVIVARVATSAVRMRAAVGISAVIGIVLTVLSTRLADNVTQFLDARPLSIALAAQSQAVYEQIQQGVADLRAHPGSETILIVNQPLDYERVLSLPEYLSYYGAADSVFLEVRIPPESAANGLMSKLTGELEQMQTQGKQDDGWRVLPSARRDGEANTVCFYFGEAAANLSTCDSAHRIG